MTLTLGHYRNELIKPSRRAYIEPASIDYYVARSIIEERPYREGASLCKIVIDTKKFSLDIGFMEQEDEQRRYPVNIGREGCETPLGRYIVIEKFENPYYRKNEGIIMPGNSNPLGDYLIILYDPLKGEKIKNSIHSWPGHFYCFRKGMLSSGCIRLKKGDMKDLFERTMLGAEVIIK